MSRTALTIVVCAAAAIVAAAFLLVDERPPPPVVATVPASAAPRAAEAKPVEVVAPPPTEPASSQPAPVAARQPVTPRYRDGSRGPRPVDDDAVTTEATPGAIYRCREGAGTTYRQEPCEGGVVVRTGGVVAGYDTRSSPGPLRPSDDGQGDAPADVLSTAPPRSMAASPPTSVECRTYRQQIADIDAEARVTTGARRLDVLRRIRQDIGDSLVRALLTVVLAPRHGAAPSEGPMVDRLTGPDRGPAYSHSHPPPGTTRRSRTRG